MVRRGESNVREYPFDADVVREYPFDADVVREYPFGLVREYALW